jgi:hypothetical protein
MGTASQMIRLRMRRHVLRLDLLVIIYCGIRALSSTPGGRTTDCPTVISLGLVAYADTLAAGRS